MLSREQLKIIKSRANSIFPEAAREDVQLLIRHIEELNKYSDDVISYGGNEIIFPFHSLVGYSYDGYYTPEDYSMMSYNKFEAVKVIGNGYMNSTNMNNLKALGVKLIIGKAQDRKLMPEMKTMYDLGIRYFDILDQPNDSHQGMFQLFRNGEEWSKFFVSIYEELHEKYPEAHIGFPGLALGQGIANRRYNAVQFLQEAWRAVEKADFLQMYAYIENEVAMDAVLDEVFQFCVNYMNKQVFIGGVSCSDEDLDDEDKRNIYRKFFKELKGMPSNFGGAFLIP